MSTPEIQARIALLRSKANDGTLTLEDMREGIKLLREERMSVASSTPSKSRTPKAPAKSATALLDELNGL